MIPLAVREYNSLFHSTYTRGANSYRSNSKSNLLDPGKPFTSSTYHELHFLEADLRVR